MPAIKINADDKQTGDGYTAEEWNHIKNTHDANVDEINRIANDHYPYVRTNAAAIWTINHNLNRAVNIAAFDIAGRQLHGQVDMINSNTIEIQFNSAVAGTAEVR